MGIFITCGTNNNDITFNVLENVTLYDDEFNGVRSDSDIVINIIYKYFNIKPSKIIISNIRIDIIYSNTNSNYDKLKTFVENIDNEISLDNTRDKGIKNFDYLHELVKGMHFNCEISNYEYNVIMKTPEIANKYYHILRCYGMDINIKNNLLNFNNIYIVNMANFDPNEREFLCDNNNVISCFYSNHKYYSSKYTFLKILSIQDKDKYFETYSLDINNINNIDDNDSYNVCNIITK
jgi:hypothetical protein